MGVKQMRPDIGGDHRNEHDDDHGNVPKRNVQVCRRIFDDRRVFLLGKRCRDAGDD
jgi:hypothetical protein